MDEIESSFAPEPVIFNIVNLETSVWFNVLYHCSENQRGGHVARLTYLEN